MSTSNKRKRDAQDGASYSTAPASIKAGSTLRNPPILASIHGVQLPKNLVLNAYEKPKANTTHNLENEYILHGETDRIEYEGNSNDDKNSLSQYIGIYDPATNTVELHPAPLIHVTSFVKSLKSKLILDRAGDANYAASKYALGTAFGTKKSRRQLLNQELNAINETSLGDSQHQIGAAVASAVDSATSAIPTRKSLQEGEANRKYIPTPNVAEGTPLEDVYKLEDLVTEKELSACKIYAWDGAVKDGKEVVSLASPHYVNARIPALVKNNFHLKLCLLKYIEHLISFYRFLHAAKHQTTSIGQLRKDLPSDDPQILTKSLIERFTDAKDGITETRVLSKTKETKLLCHIAVLCLRVDGFRMDIFDLVQDLQIERKVLEGVFKEVGAVIKTFTQAQAESMHIPKDEIREHRMAVMKLPLMFPKAMRGGGNKRR